MIAALLQAERGRGGRGKRGGKGRGEREGGIEEEEGRERERGGDLHAQHIYLTCPSSSSSHNTATLELIHHPPEVSHSALQWTLCSYVGTLLLVTLHVCTDERVAYNM